MNTILTFFLLEKEKQKQNELKQFGYGISFQHVNYIVATRVTL